MQREFVYNGVKVAITGPRIVEEPVAGDDFDHLIGDWYDVLGNGLTVGHFRAYFNQRGGLSVDSVIPASDVFEAEDLEQIAELAVADGVA